MRTNGTVDRYEELRSLLLGPEQALLEALRGKVDHPQRTLADDILVRPDGKLRRALQPLVEQSLQLSVRRNPRMLAEALFPIFGQAIRKAINAELEQKLEGLGQTLEQRVSLRSIEWRLEALRTRKPYAEVVLLRSLLYRVEQVFLIHRKTGLLLMHVAADEKHTKDPEMVSGMLTAIQDFVHDSMQGSEGENLDMVRMGDVGLVLTYTTDAILCGFVRGVAPRRLMTLFQDTLDGIVRDKAEALAAFSGDTADFETCRPQLQALLLGQGSGKAATRTPRLLLIAAAALLLIALVSWWAYATAMNRRLSQLAQKVAAEPGFVVTEATRQGGGYVIRGLRDPLAPEPATLGLPVKFEWQDYHSLAPRFANQRHYNDLKEQLEGNGFRFATGVSEIPAEQRFLLEDLAAKILTLLRAGALVGKTPQITVVGNHDPIGSERLNAGLAQARAENVRAALVAMGVPEPRLTAASADRERETCSAVKEEERFECRSAVFIVR